MTKADHVYANLRADAEAWQLRAERSEAELATARAALHNVAENLYKAGVISVTARDDILRAMYRTTPITTEDDDD